MRTNANASGNEPEALKTDHDDQKDSAPDVECKKVFPPECISGECSHPEHQEYIECPNPACLGRIDQIKGLHTELRDRYAWWVDRRVIGEEAKLIVQGTLKKLRGQIDDLIAINDRQNEEIERLRRELALAVKK